jgi:hypothetical protein
MFVVEVTDPDHAVHTHTRSIRRRPASTSGAARRGGAVVLDALALRWPGDLRG